MPLVVGILHSPSGEYSVALRQEAASCLTALHRALAPSSPDFIPRLAVLQADPLGGARYLYSCATRDTNHAAALPELWDCAAEAAGNTNSSDGAASAAAASSSPTDAPSVDEALALLLRHRSPHYMRRCVLQGLEVPAAAAVKQQSAGAGAAAGPPSGSPSRDGWACLAGALLTSLCFLIKHGRPSLVPPPPPPTSATATTASASPSFGSSDANGTLTAGNSNQGDADAAVPAPPLRLPSAVGGTTAAGADKAVPAIVVIFTDEEREKEKRSGQGNAAAAAPAAAGTPGGVSFTTDSALAVAVTRLVSYGAKVVCYGLHAPPAAAAAATDAETTPNGTGGPQRLRALCGSTGGFCAPRFSLAQMGALLSLLAPPSSLTAPNTNDNSNSNNNSSNSNSAEALERQKRERLTGEYIVTPAMLPHDPPRVASRSARCGEAKKEENEENEEEEEKKKKQRKRKQLTNVGDGDGPAQTRAHTGWLCPECMCIVERYAGDGFEAVGERNRNGSDITSGGDGGGDEDDDDAGGDGGAKCPYCSLFAAE